MNRTSASMYTCLFVGLIAVMRGIDAAQKHRSTFATLYLAVGISAIVFASWSLYRRSRASGARRD